MRLHRIELKNLNSLYGEQSVDLDGQLGDAPVFLILGPTGSGKSTLMDAIALALFGQTPRLSNARNEPDADARNVMSRGTGEAFARLEFSKKEEGARRRYRATWSCHRARKRADGDPQDPTRTLERLDSATGEWETLVSDRRAKFFQPELDRVLEGLTVKDFQRSMLLAQGEFAAFLKATETERAAILERLTNTSEYREIGARAAKRRSQSGKKVEFAEKLCGEVKLLSPEQEQALRDEEIALAALLVTAKAEADRVRTLLGWRAQLDELTARVSEATEQRGKLLDERKEHESELARLAEHERCAGATMALNDLKRSETELSRLAEALPQAAATLTAAKAALQAQEESEKALRARSETTAAELESKKPQIDLARKVRAELKSARDELKKAGDRQAEAQRKAAKSTEAETAAVEASAAADKRLDEAKSAVEAAEPARPLIEGLQALRARHEALGRVREREKKLEGDLAKTAKGVLDGEARLDGVRKALAETGERVAEAKNRASEARAALDVELQGSADARARRKLLADERTGLGVRLRALDQLDGIEAQRRDAAVQLSRAQTELEALSGSLEELTRATGARGDERNQAAARVDEARARLEHLRWKQSTARLRSELHDGEPCPLCGGTDHPSAADPRLAEADRRVDGEIEALQKELGALQAAHEAADKAFGKAGQKEAAARGKLEAEQAAAAKLQAAAEKLASQAAPLLERLGLPSPVESEAVDAERRAIDANQRKLDELSERLERAEAGLLAAANALTQVETEEARHRTAEAETQAKLEGERQRALDLKAEAGRAAIEGEDERRKLAEALAACALPIALDARDAELSAALDEAGRRMNALLQAERTMREAEKQSGEARSKVGTTRVAREAAEGELKTAAEDLAARQARVDALTAEAAIPLGGADPDKVELELGTAAKVARQSWEKGEEVLAAGRSAHATAATRLTELERQREEREKARSEGASALAQQLERLGLPDRPSLKSRLLTDQERGTLVELRNRLDSALKTAEVTLQERQRMLGEHRAAKPDGFDEAAQTVEVLLEASAAAAEKLDAQTRAHEEKKGQIKAQEEAQARAGKLREELEAARREHEVWERLHDLIGRADGEHFKNYAQLLNLRDLLGKANDHLRRLSPRYALVPGKNAQGEARLTFAVRDAYHADDERPLSTLSGGETFLASLALALALADYRTVRMPIETLLLDEGFGTLDPETLQVAMNALSALNATGTQVGIISHVEGLRERFDARIVVERMGNGRSRVKVEASGA